MISFSTISRLLLLISPRPPFTFHRSAAAFLTQSVVINQEYTVKFEIWDTAGQERYHSLAPMYYRGAAAAVVAYDVTNPQSFERAQAWVKELQRQSNASNMVIALAGNKCDKPNKVITPEVLYCI